MTTYKQELHNFQLDYILRMVVIFGPNQCKIAAAMKMHRNSVYRILRRNGYNATRLREWARSGGAMDSNEQHVREKWEHVHVCDGSYSTYAHGTVLIRNVDGCWLDFDSMQAAADFTRAHEKKISDVEEEIRLIEYCRDTYYWCEEEPATIQRILAARQAALDELRKGWRG